MSVDMDVVTDDRGVRTLTAVLLGDRSAHQIAARLGCSPSTAHLRLLELRDAGLVDWDGNLRGSLHLTARIIR